MILNLYNAVVQILGEIPSEYHFVYAICTIILFMIILWCIVFPFKFIYESCFK